MANMKVKKIIYIILIVFFIIFSFSKVYAADSIVEQGNSWLNSGEQNRPGETTISKVFTYIWKGQEHVSFTQIAGMLQGIGIFIIAIVGVVLGIRMMFAEPEGKAKVKQAFIIYIIGSVVIIGAVGIWRLMISILDVL